MVLKDEIRSLIAQRIEDSGMSMMALSKMIGRNQAYIQQYLERGTPQYLPEEERYKVAEILAIDENKLKKVLKIDIEDKKLLNQKNMHVIREVQYGPDTVPVYGAANGSSEALVLNFDEPIGEVAKHPNQTGMQKAFAVYTHGNSMSPRYRDGELVYVAANRRPTKGQDCIVEMENGESFIKEFIKTTDKEIICGQLFPQKEWKRPLSGIRAIHAIVGRG